MAYEGERVRLRAIEPGDAETMFRWINDREVTRHLDLRYPTSLEWERQWASDAKQRGGYRNVTFAIERREDGLLLGTCGLHGATPEDRVVELGLNIGEKSMWGQGYGFDTLRTLLCFGFREMNLRRVYLHVMEDHPRARALYERAGFEYEGRHRESRWTRGQATALLTMSITRPEFDERYGAAEEVGDVPRR
ncbi:MAG: GNAT family N-acetyltransferase [Dehalococcoidia bacterium]|nr:GNAT family N-acetyltransferase [Dehalococcoidia bacterium]